MRTYPDSERAASARALVEDLQQQLADALARLSAAHGHPTELARIEWLRDDGRHGGGMRYAAVETPVFNRVAINTSVVHYDDVPDKRLASATALSTIIHPANPHAPSMHMHISWTELRDGEGYWRVMADLNPALPVEAHRARFEQILKEAAGDLWADASTNGDRYFTIPALERTRGVCHFYLEAHTTGDFEADRALARRVGEEVTQAYCAIVDDALRSHDEAPSEEALGAQLSYHTVYLFQVLTLDRGTTSGLLVHDQNDSGIMGSLPAHVDRALLSSWASRVPEPQQSLVEDIVAALPDAHPSPVTESVRLALAKAVREHYRAHPEALKLQASGAVVPPTVANHGPGH